MISVKDIAWTAGFIEGEGSFINATTNNSIAISVSQVQLEPLERLRLLYGGSICKRIRAKNPTWSPSYVWTLSGYKAFGLALTIFCLLSPRRKEQALKIINAWKAKRGYKWKSVSES